jgi:hypothetical protein
VHQMQNPTISVVGEIRQHHRLSRTQSALASKPIILTLGVAPAAFLRDKYA